MRQLGSLYPIAEIIAWYFFIERYSFLDAVMLVVSTGIVGLIIVAMNGRALLAEQRRSLQQGVPNTPRIFYRLATIFGGLLIFLPGLIAKVSGSLLILPGTRQLALWILRRFFHERVIFQGYDFFMSNIPGGVRDVVEVQPISIEHQTKDDQDRH